MPLSAEQEKQFNDNARLARAELGKSWNDWKARDVAVWWDKWHTKAGHVRLGRILMEVTGVALERRGGIRVRIPAPEKSDE